MEVSSRISQQSKTEHAETLRRSKSRSLDLVSLSALMVLAVGLRVLNLETLGLGNHYYAAAVESMLMSWHNLFFVAAEPGGSVSVDKPPVGLWLQALTARILGVNTVGLLLPQLIAGLLSIILLYHLIKRKFGAPAGLLAALVLTITPVVVATDRNNTMDSTLILLLLLAAWAFTKATETNKLKFLLVSAIFLGIAFNIKMLEAFLPLPAFLAVYLLGAEDQLLRKVGKLALTIVVLLAISLSWAVAVDLIPANQRPYVGSSGDNSELSLIIGYNGIERLVGMFGRSRDRPGNNQSIGRYSPSNPGLAPSQGSKPSIPGIPPGGFQPGSPGSPPPGSAPPGGSPLMGFNGTGQVGPLRLFIPPLSNQASWLLPLALFFLGLLMISERFTWPITFQHQAAILWGGWLLTAGIFFSIAGFFHEYYLSTVAPPLAALVGIGTLHAWQKGKDRPRLLAIVLVFVTILTLFVQYNTAKAFISKIPWLPVVVVFLAIGLLSLLFVSIFSHPMYKTWMMVGMAALLAAMLITPGAWSYLTNRYPVENQSLPAAYGGKNSIPANGGKIQVDTNLLKYLLSNTQGVKYLMAVPSSMQGADYVLATGRPVLYMGGFMGQDQVLTPESLARLISNGLLRYIYWNPYGVGPPDSSAFGGQSLITNWVSANCQMVQGFDASAQNFGASDGITSEGVVSDFRGGRLTAILYDCRK